MPVEEFSKIIGASVTPVVVISASGLLCLAFYNRLAAIVSRLRGFHRERLHEQDEIARLQSETPIDDDHLTRHRRILEHLDMQVERVLRRARLIRSTLFCLLATIAMLVLCSIALAFAVPFPAVFYVAAAAFLIGMCLLLAATIFAAREMFGALNPAEIEASFVADLASSMPLAEEAHQSPVVRSPR
jgi:hypothetical protein